MSRILKVMVALLAIAAIAAPVMAEDRLGLSGEMRVRGWYVDDGGDSTSTWADQRLRIGGKLSVAEGVSVTFRTDVTEVNWGNGGSEFGSGRMASTQQWDRAHLDLDMGSVHLRAGQQYVGYGLAQTINSQDAGFKIDVKGPVTFSAFALLDDDRGTSQDSFLLGANVGHKTDAYAANVFVGRQNQALDAAEEAYLLGADLAFNLQAVKLTAEVGYFTGDATETADVMGLQLLLDASIAASDMFTVGGQFYYAQAADSDEVQYQVLGNDFNGWDPLFDVGTWLSNEQIGLGRPFDFTGDGAGVIGGRLYANLKVSDAVGLGFSGAYLTPEDDANTDVDSAYALAAGITYAVMANTNLHAQVEYIDPDAPGAEATTNAGVGLFVNF